MSEVKAKINIFKPTKSNSFVWFNTLFLIGLLVTGYADAMTIIVAYFLETFIIGVFHVLKMYKIAKFHKESLFSMRFFMLHYSFFIALQLVFVFVILQTQHSEIEEPMFLLHNIKYVMSFKGMNWILISQVLFNFLDFFFNFLDNKTYETVHSEDYLIKPYKRIVVQQLAVIIGFFMLQASFSAIILALLIIVIRSLLDFFMLSKEK